MGEEGERDAGITRRAVLRDGSVLALAVLAAGPASALGNVAVEVRSAPAFLTQPELETLRALVDRFIPGRPEDAHDGAVAAGCAEAIDGLLGSFASSPPRIYAGAPFSDRAGSPKNHFAEFLALDPYEEKGWRLRIEGSRGDRRLEFNGPVRGFQEIYRDGLAALAARGFASLPGPARDLALRDAEGDPKVAALIDIAWPHTFQFMYGAPEYGGNRDLVAWRYADYDGDVQPRGWTREEIERGPEPGSRMRSLEESPIPPERLVALAPLGASAELMSGVIERSGGTLSGLREELGPVAEWIERGGADGG